MSNFKNIAALCVKQIKTTLEQRLCDEEKLPATQIADAYLGKIKPKTLAQQPVLEICSKMMSLWRFIKQCRQGEVLARVYNPSSEEHQWHSTHSIIEILCSNKPFLLTSILMELDRQNIQVYSLNHVVYEACRDKDNVLTGLVTTENTQSKADKHVEFVLYIEIERQSAEQELNRLKSAVCSVLNDVHQARHDWQPMRSKLSEIIESYAEAINGDSPVSVELHNEELAFLKWLLDGDNFLFAGYAYYAFTEQDKKHTLTCQKESGLGLLSKDGSIQQPSSVLLTARQTAHYLQPALLVLTKSTIRSTLHRPGHLDHIGIKQYKKGKVVGEWRFCGLLSFSIHSNRAHDIPLIRQKVKHITRSIPAEDAHRLCILEYVINQYPRDELLQADTAYLQKTVLDIISRQERRQLGVFIRTDHCDQFVTVIVYLLKERYTTELRLQFQQLLTDTFNSHSIDFHIVSTDHPLTQVLLRVHCNNASEHNVDIDMLEAYINDLTMRWEDRQQKVLVEKFGEAKGQQLHRKYVRAFPAAYCEDGYPLQAVTDIEVLETLTQNKAISTRLYYPMDQNDQLHFRVLGSGKAIALSDVLPILEQMGVKVIDARPYSITPEDTSFWILDFVISPVKKCDLRDREFRELFQELFIHAWSNNIEKDKFNALAINAKLNWQHIVLIRAFSRYLLQLQVPFSQQYMEEAVNNSPVICRGLIDLFFIRFNPDFKGDRQKEFSRQLEAIELLLENVNNRDEDRILRHFLSLIQALLRTNFFQSDEEGFPKKYLSFKLSPELLVIAPQPRLKYEIFVYSPRIEGVHMRAGKVARGGLRWSDRKEDFRTEILGLAKAQMVKNAVIVPLGAKGGFITKNLPADNKREEIMAEGIACYRIFISGMLDVTDNMQGKEIIPPPSVVRHDDSDPYLVVAADKGTATFSDIANDMAARYKFWLGDAFASGGSQGYDHKGMGITAKGAWESVKRLFWERGINIQKQSFTVAGIGDMSGDVFGNGMLLSRHIRLVAAFNHLHIFIDPDPDPEASFKERQRLFSMDRSSWADYDPSLISKGGGIYSRSQKSVQLSSEAQSLLETEAGTLSPEELIQAILRAKIDLLWNGGIGTYIKHSKQANESVGDRSNDNLRIDASDLRASVIGEGGNLGLTQKARIEFSLNGGLVNTDAVDNSAGVDCSDHEVNIKILLNQAVAEGDMTIKQRNKLLASMTEELSALILKNNYLQTKGLTLTVSQGNRVLLDQRRLIRLLEKEKRLNRKLESLPSDAALSKINKNGEGLERPSISVLLAHIKLKLFDDLIASDIHRDTYLITLLSEYFPKAIQTTMPERIQAHPLKAEILATHIINDVCNRMGAYFIDRIQQEVRCSSADAIRAYMTVREVFNLQRLWNELEAVEYQLNEELVRKELLSIRKHVEKSSIWLLRRHGSQLDVTYLINLYRQGIEVLDSKLPDHLGQSDQSLWADKQNNLVESGMPPELARTCANLYYLYFGFGIIDTAEKSKYKVNKTAEVYFALEEHLELHWLREQINLLADTDLWQRKSREALHHQLNCTLNSHCAHVINHKSQSTGEALQKWLLATQPHILRWQRVVADIQASEELNLAMLSVAMKELSLLTES